MSNLNDRDVTTKHGEGTMPRTNTKEPSNINKYSLKDWQDLPLGGVVAEGGNSNDYETGTWRTSRPIWNEKHCINCLQCWVFCPEEAYFLKDGTTKKGKPRKEIEKINYYHCKGCGLCAKECPVNKKGKKLVIEMVEEKT